MTVSKPFVLYSVSDSAIDDEAMGSRLTAYARERDESLVIVRDGEKATKFYCADIHTSVYNSYVQAAATDAERYQRAFEVGVVKVENLTEKDGTFRSLVTPTDSIRTAVGTTSKWSSDEVNLFWPAYISEIGAVLDIRCGVPLGRGQTYPLARLSLHALLARMQFLAASIPDEQAPTNDEDKEAPSIQTEENGDEGIGAPVTASQI